MAFALAVVTLDGGSTALGRSAKSLRMSFSLTPVAYQRTLAFPFVDCIEVIPLWRTFSGRANVVSFGARCRSLRVLGLLRIVPESGSNPHFDVLVRRLLLVEPSVELSGVLDELLDFFVRRQLIDA